MSFTSASTRNRTPSHAWKVPMYATTVLPSSPYFASTAGSLGTGVKRSTSTPFGITWTSSERNPRCTSSFLMPWQIATTASACRASKVSAFWVAT